MKLTIEEAHEKKQLLLRVIASDRNDKLNRAANKMINRIDKACDTLAKAYQAKIEDIGDDCVSVDDKGNILYRDLPNGQKERVFTPEKSKEYRKRTNAEYDKYLKSQCDEFETYTEWDENDPGYARAKDINLFVKEELEGILFKAQAEPASVSPEGKSLAGGSEAELQGTQTGEVEHIEQ